MRLYLYALTMFLGVILTVHLSMNGKVGAVIGNPRVGNALFWCIGAVMALIIGATGWQAGALERAAAGESAAAHRGRDGRVARVRHRVDHSSDRRAADDRDAPYRADPQRDAAVAFRLAGISRAAGVAHERAWARCS